MDFSIEQWINGPAGTLPVWDALMKAAAGYAEPFFILVVAGWFLAGWVQRSRADRRGAITALLAAGGALLVDTVISHVWNRPRPFAAHPGTVHLLLSHSNDASFPSDHVAAATAISVVLVAVHRRAGVAALVVTAVVAYARVYVGDHYPGDVAGGAVVGLAVAVLLLTWLRSLPDVASRVTDTVMARLHLVRAGPEAS